MYIVLNFLRMRWLNYLRMCCSLKGKTVSLYSAPFFTSRHGYKICLRVYLNGDGSGRGSHVSFFLTIMKGEYDPLLPWPYRQTTVLMLLALDGVSRDITQSFKPDEESSSFQIPQTEMNVASGCPQFCPQRMLENPSYCKNDTIYLKAVVNLRGIEHITWFVRLLFIVYIPGNLCEELRNTATIFNLLYI